jgi:hypothetical protein
LVSKCAVADELRGITSPYIERMNAIHLTDTEMAMAKHALQAYLQTFGHDEAARLTRGDPSPTNPTGRSR